MSEKYFLYARCFRWENEMIGYSLVDVGLEADAQFSSDDEARDFFKDRQKNSILQQAYDKVEYILYRGGVRFEGGGTEIYKWIWAKAQDTRRISTGIV